MTYWFFTVTNKKIDGESVTAKDILSQRLSDGFWGLGEKTPNRRNLHKGDQVVFYVGLPDMTFSASATLSSDPFVLSEEQRGRYWHGKKVYEAEYGVLLEDIRLWETPRSVKELVAGLKFIENKENWFAYFQGGVRQISEDDYRTIVDNRRALSVETKRTEDVIVSDSQFALEAHLEEFIDKNWKHINFGAELAKYEAEDQNGRQFPAGPWSIDFLCLDKGSGDFVVVELKRGKTSDAAVGQVLRYIGWVEENLARPDQNVRGIIISQEADDGLKYAVRSLSNVSLWTYKVDFKLSPFRR